MGLRLDGCEIVVARGRITVDAPQLGARYEVYGNAPVQGFGAVSAREIYFRARHDGWSFEVADHQGRLPSDGFRDSDGFHLQGAYANASWMPVEKAVRIIDECLRQYVSRAPR
jgi:hypothetical protein